MSNWKVILLNVANDREHFLHPPPHQKRCPHVKKLPFKYKCWWYNSIAFRGEAIILNKHNKTNYVYKKYHKHRYLWNTSWKRAIWSVDNNSVTILVYLNKDDLFFLIYESTIIRKVNIDPDRFFNISTYNQWNPHRVKSNKKITLWHFVPIITF